MANNFIYPDQIQTGNRMVLQAPFPSAGRLGAFLRGLLDRVYVCVSLFIYYAAVLNAEDSPNWLICSHLANKIRINGFSKGNQESHGKIQMQ